MKIKIIATIALIIILLSANTCSTYAIGSFSDIKQAAESFIKKGGTGKIDAKDATDSLLPLGNILAGIGVLVLLITGCVMGVKYMIAGADEKAKIKEKLIWWCISVVVIFGAIGIVNIVIKVMNSVLS